MDVVVAVERVGAGKLGGIAGDGKDAIDETGDVALESDEGAGTGGRAITAEGAEQNVEGFDRRRFDAVREDWNGEQRF